ncbi:MAG TPA: hypothetical protein VEY50_02115, partial [Lysobacter sp.]|nr:hypothetical protein [Lysobacter sp.]
MRLRTLLLGAAVVGLVAPLAMAQSNTAGAGARDADARKSARERDEQRRNGRRSSERTREREQAQSLAAAEEQPRE